MICHPKQIKIGTAELELNWQATGMACNTPKTSFCLGRIFLRPLLKKHTESFLQNEIHVFFSCRFARFFIIIYSSFRN